MCKGDVVVDMIRELMNVSNLVTMVTSHRPNGKGLEQ